MREGKCVYWYFIYDRFDHQERIIEYFNQQVHTRAFIPKIEKWLGCSSVKDYVLKDLYPHYILVQSSLDEEDFLERYKEFFKDIDMLANLLKQGDLHQMSDREKGLYEKLFNEKEVIVHSIGTITDGKLIVEEGPLKGYEDFIERINRHKRDCFLNLNDIQIKMPLEVVSRR